jgi:hypothetical protein
MATVMKLRWEGLTPDQYEASWEILDLDNNPADGGGHHISWFDDAGLNAVDVWESQGHFERFMNERIMPAVSEVGIEGQPSVEFHELQREWSPPT